MYLYFIIIIIILYYLTNHYNQNIENFYTLFLPFYEPNTIAKYNFYKNNESKYNIKYNVNFLISNNQYKYTNLQLFIKSLIAYHKSIININLSSSYNNDRNILSNINNINNINNNLAIIPSPIVINELINNEINNINFITTMNEQYIFIISASNTNIDTIYDLYNKKIGVGEKNSLWEQCANDIFTNMNIKYKPYYSNLQNMLQSLYNNDIDAIVITDSFPSNLLNFIFYNFYNLHLVSLENIYNFNIYNKTSIDLNKLPALYIPQASYKNKHNKYKKATLFYDNNKLDEKYLFYNSQFITYKFSNYLLANKNFDQDLAYIITKHIFNNSKLLQKSINEFPIYNIPFNKGAKKYYVEKGYISYNSSINCIYTYGKQKCNGEYTTII